MNNLKTVLIVWGIISIFFGLCFIFQQAAELRDKKILNKIEQLKINQCVVVHDHLALFLGVNYSIDCDDHDCRVCKIK